VKFKKELAKDDLKSGDKGGKAAAKKAATAKK
jgi:hypothetical protein